MSTYANPQVALNGIDQFQDAAGDLVTSRFESAQAAGESALGAALSMLGAIGNIGTIQAVTFVPSFNTPQVPGIDIDIPQPSIPGYMAAERPGGEIVIGDVLINIGNAPGFDVAPIIPVIPEFPDLIFPELTEERPTVREVTLPNEPPFEMPEAPVMNLVVLPEPISLDLPTFDALVPVENIQIPNNMIDPGILEYDSPVLQMLKAKILQWITTSGTGLDPVIEQEIYDRDEERARLALEQAKQDFIEEWSKRGFILPDGVLAANLMALEIDHKNKRLDTSREIVINQAKLSQENTHFYIQQALSLETQLMNWTNLIGQRTFEASKAAADVAISITQADIARYNVKLQAYQVQAQVYESRIRSELAKVEIYKAQIEAARLSGELNRIAAEVYKTRIEAIGALIGMYEARIKAAMAGLEVDKARIDAFQGLVQAYIAQVNGITSKYNAYNSRIEGEKTKVSIYTAQVDAFKGRVEAFKTEAEARIEEAKALISRNELLIKKYGVDVEAGKVSAIASAEHAKTVSEAHQATVAAARAKAEAQTAAAQVGLKAAELQIEQSVRIAEAVRNTQEINIRAFLAAENLRVEAARGGAAVAAQMAAGAFAGVSVSAAIGAHGNASKSFSGQESLGESHNFTHQP